MRILQVVQKPQRRGPEILSQRLDVAFRQRGHAARTVFLYPYSGEAPLELSGDDVCLEGIERHPAETTFGFHPRLLRLLRREIARFDPDIVQVNGSRSVKYGAFAALASPRRRWKLVYRNIDNPDYWVRGAIRQVYYRHLVMPMMDGVVAVSEGMIEALRRRYGFRVPTTWIPYVVDPARLEPVMNRQAAREHLGVEEHRPLVLFVGNLSAQKRPDRFLRVLRQVRDRFPEVVGWLVGDGVDRESVERQVAQLGLSDAVKLWGYQSQIGPFMAAADLLLITSDSDGIPTIVQESGFLGTPVIATRVGGMAECVLAGETGLLADAEDEAGLVSSVTTLLEEPSLRARMGDAARKLVRSRFTIEQAVEEQLTFFERLRRGEAGE